MTSILTPRQKLDQREPLTLQELARLAGCSVAQLRKYRQADPGCPAVYRVGRLVRVRADEAERFLRYIGAMPSEFAHGSAPGAQTDTARMGVHQAHGSAPGA